MITYPCWDHVSKMEASVIHVAVNWVIIGLGDGLSHVQRQAITRSNADLMSIGSLGKKDIQI